MKSLIKRLRSVLWTFNMTFMLTVNLFLIIATVLTVVAGAAWLGIQIGWLEQDSLLRPVSVMIVIYIICILIGVGIVVMIRLVILQPIRGMVTAMKRLAGGDFDVRMVCKGWMRPLELREFTDAFNIAAQELGGTELLRKDFINNFSHEFKTPITSLGGFADLILEDDEMPEEERREYLHIISDEAHRLAALASNVLTMSRVEAQSILIDAVPFNLTEQLRQTALMLEQKWAKRRINLQLDMDECQYTGSESLLKEVWVNLLDNAIKFSPESSEVVVVLRHTSTDITITVQDRGLGMDEATQSRIFDQFYQGDTSHKTEGNGLGLAMVQKIVALHKGSVTVQSKPGSGSTFTVILPTI